MENFRVELKKRILVVPIASAVIILVTVLGIIYKAEGSNEGVSDFISGFHFGFTIGILGVSIVLAIKYAIALRDEEKLRKLYIKETDERTLYIQSQIGGAGINIIIAGLAIGTVIAGYMNEVAFFTLLGAVFFTGAVKITLKVFYNHKY